MGVDLNEVARRRENRKKDDASDKPLLFSDIFERDGSMNIDLTTSKFEKLMRDADQGKFLGMGKDGKLDGREISEAVAKISKDYDIELPANLRDSLQSMKEDKDFRVDIKETVQEMREKMNAADKNDDGEVSPKELLAAVKQMER